MIKMFEQFNNEQEIREICEKYKIKNYTINPDGSIDVDGGVNLYDMNLTELPLKFNMVSGHFIISHNRITSLDGCPREVGGDFYCYNNNLVTLKGGPEFVDGCYRCSENKLESLKYSPLGIERSLFCEGNNIKTLEGFPMIIKGSLNLRNNPISIIDESIKVGETIYLENTNIDEDIQKMSNLWKRLVFEHGVEYDIYDKDGLLNRNRLLKLLKDFKEL